MPSEEFFFSIEVSSQGVPAALVEDIASRVLRYVGGSMALVPELTAAFETAAGAGGAGAPPRCDVQFRVQGERLDVLVSANGGRVWQQTLTIS